MKTFMLFDLVKKIPVFFVTICLLACVPSSENASSNMSQITKNAINDVTEYNNLVTRLYELLPDCITDFKSRDHQTNSWFFDSCKEMRSLGENLRFKGQIANDGALRITHHALQLLEQGILPPTSLERLNDDYKYSSSRGDDFLRRIKNEMGMCYFNFNTVSKYMFITDECCAEYKTYHLNSLDRACEGRK